MIFWFGYLVESRGWRNGVRESVAATPAARPAAPELFAKVGSFYRRRENFRLTPEVKGQFTEKLRPERERPGGKMLAQAVRQDVRKLVLENTGPGAGNRSSGTEPVVRVYIPMRRARRSQCS